ncbi:MAG: FAD-dependent oxidoreductase [Calditrichaeota bacterium]|jgi:ferredoxin-NADP reductase|nr:FAD-dependent oxidoreductase [Calditrichota bacterium]
MLVKKYKSEVISISNPIEGVYTLKLAPQKGRFKYSPGQFLHLAIDDSYDGVGQWPDSRCFSLQSNTNEENIRITYAVKGKFTREMEQTLTTGSEVWLKLPYGELFSQSHEKTKVVFIAGGTGITPFLSLFTDASFGEYISPKIYLGFKTEKYNIYEHELNLVRSNSYTIAMLLEDIDGKLDIRSIFSDNGTDASYFISGPPVMITTFKSKLKKYGVPSNNIYTDDWE